MGKGVPTWASSSAVGVAVGVGVGVTVGVGVRVGVRVGLGVNVMVGVEETDAVASKAAASGELQAAKVMVNRIERIFRVDDIQKERLLSLIIAGS